MYGNLRSYKIRIIPSLDDFDSLYQLLHFQVYHNVLKLSEPILEDKRCMRSFRKRSKKC